MDKWQRTWLIFRNTWVESTAQIEFFISLLSVATISGILTYNDYLSYAKIIGLVTVPEVLIRVINSPYSYFFIVGGLFIYLMLAIRNLQQTGFSPKSMDPCRFWVGAAYQR